MLVSFKHIFICCFNRVLPVLEPEYVAEETIKAIITDEPICILPKHMSILMGLKA